MKAKRGALCESHRFNSLLRFIVGPFSDDRVARMRRELGNNFQFLLQHRFGFHVGTAMDAPLIFSQSRNEDIPYQPHFSLTAMHCPID